MFLCSFNLANHYGKCRRSIILEHFDEDLPENQVEVLDECCDVCSQSSSVEMVDCSHEMKSIIQAVKDRPNKGEKKVRHINVTSVV